MKIHYDFHIHSALSPCSSDDMTPYNIMAMAAVRELNAIAVADHNSIKNIPAVIAAGKAFGITVLPAIEVQTAEDIHVVALFDEYNKLSEFYKLLKFPSITNRPDIYGNQLIFNVDDEIIGQEENLLHVSCQSGVYQVVDWIISIGGKAVAAHIDREANGILSILGAVPHDLNISAVEFSPNVPKQLKDKYNHFVKLTNSDAHELCSISPKGNTLTTLSSSPKDILASI